MISTEVFVKPPATRWQEPATRLGQDHEQTTAVFFWSPVQVIKG